MNQGNSEPEADNIDLKFLSSIVKKKNSDITGDRYMASAESANYNSAVQLRVSRVVEKQGLFYAKWNEV